MYLYRSKSAYPRKSPVIRAVNSYILLGLVILLEGIIFALLVVACLTHADFDIAYLLGNTSRTSVLADIVGVLLALPIVHHLIQSFSPNLGDDPVSVGELPVTHFWLIGGVAIIFGLESSSLAYYALVKALPENIAPLLAAPPVALAMFFGTRYILRGLSPRVRSLT